MPGWLQSVLDWLLRIPEGLLLLILGLAAALENIIPPIPADVIILFGGFLAGQGVVSPWLAFAVVWVGNVGGALLVYAVGRTYGPGFFSGRIGGYLLKPRQLASLSDFYRRFGFAVIFVSRFTPVFRALVPVFAGVSHVGFFRTAIPIAVASAIWYGTLLYLGAAAGQNWQQIAGAVEESGRWLWLGAGLAALLLAVWWKRSRRGGEGEAG